MTKKHTLEDLKKIIATFINERDWEQYTSLKNASINISVELQLELTKFNIPVVFALPLGKPMAILNSMKMK